MFFMLKALLCPQKREKRPSVLFFGVIDYLPHGSETFNCDESKMSHFNVFLSATSRALGFERLIPEKRNELYFDVLPL